MLAGGCFPFDLHCDKLKSLKTSRSVSEAAQELRALIFGSIFMHGLFFFGQFLSNLASLFVKYFLYSLPPSPISHTNTHKLPMSVISVSSCRPKQLFTTFTSRASKHIMSSFPSEQNPDFLMAGCHTQIVGRLLQGYHTMFE